MIFDEFNPEHLLRAPLYVVQEARSLSMYQTVSGLSGTFDGAL